ncbi:MAG: hypothetical protein WD810_00870 [Solirubrobacterales bacterium]
MGKTREQVLEWESRWSLPVGLATFAGVAVLVASAFVIGSISGGGDAEILRSAHEHSSSVTLSSALEAIGFVLLVAPLYFLFRAVAARSDQVRYQLIGLVVAAPLFFALAAVLNANATNEAADQFTSGQAKSTLTAKEAGAECKSELKDMGAKEFGEEFDAKGLTPEADCIETKVADDEAGNAISEASTRGVATGFGLGARLGLAVALFYSCLHAMRVGLLTRFWGSLGMALGVAALLLLVQFTLIWFVYFGLLLTGRIPGGRPPAWAAGEAIPWPTPGEKMAAELEPPEEDHGPSLPPANGNGGGPEPGPERRKRKQRD